MESPAINSIRAVKRERSQMRVRMTLIFFIVLIAEVIAAYFTIYKNGQVMGDAVSRTANAYFVLFLEPAKLASIGFVWNPLPSLVQLLIVPFSVFWKPLATVGFAGAIATAFFAAANAALLFRYFRQAGLSVTTAILLVSLYVCNPFVFYYGFNGMSETFFYLHDRRHGEFRAVDRRQGNRTVGRRSSHAGCWLSDTVRGFRPDAGVRSGDADCDLPASR